MTREITSSGWSTDLEKFVLDEAYSNKVLNNLQDFIGEGSINVLINNAAIQTLGDLQTAKIAEWQNSLNINLLAPFLLSQKLANKLKGGSIVNISSIHARMTKKNFLVYSTTKAALSGLTRALAIDMAGRVRVNAVEPAAINTEMLEAGFSANPSFMDELIKSHPVGKIGDPHEFAKFVLFIADSGDVFISGSIIPYDGCVGITLPN
jgi:NAD(P)-dependent dehydrogenase (short-subunit alcohol dehydrogenase family)